MVIIPPHADPAHASPAGILGTESLQEKAEAEQNGLGLFAKILAGLQEKNGTTTHTATETYDSVGAVEQTELNPVHKEGHPEGFPKMNALTASLTEAAKTEQQGETDLQTGLSRQVPDILAGFDTGLPAEQLGELRALTSENSEIYLLASANPAMEAVDPPRVSQETISPQLPQQREVSTLTETAPATEQATVRAGELAEKPRNSNENAKTDIGSSEISAAAATKEGGDEGLIRKVETAVEPNVRDQRRGYAADARNLNAQTETAHSGANASETRVYGEGNSRDIVLELRTPTQNGTASATTTWENRPAQGFESMLARELHQHINGDIVRQASIILREGNEGLIRLALKPESLGNVKIHLEMAENKITGYIVVESEEALRAFEREIAALEKEFLEAGFEGAELKMSLSNEGGDQQWNEAEDGRLQLAASRYDASAEMTETTDMYWQGTGTVDVLA